MTDNTDTFIKRLFGFSLGPIFSAIIGFLMTPITTYLVIPDEFGKASMYTMALGLSSIFIYLGIDQAFAREYNAKEDKNSLFWNSFLVPFSFSLVIGLIYIIFYKQISFLLFDSSEKFIMYILAASLPLSIFFRFNSLLIRMQEKAKLFSLISIIQKTVNLPLLMLLLLLVDKSFKSIILAQFISLLVASIFTTIVNRAIWKHKFIFDKKLVISLLKFGLPLIPAAIFGWVLNSMDKIALRSWSDFHELGLYDTAFKIVLALNLINQAFSTFWAPTSYRWHENGVNKDKFVLVSQNVMTLFVIIFGVLVLSRDYIIMILDKNYAAASIMVPFLLLYPVMYTTSETTGCGINFSRKTSYQIIVTAIAAFVNFLGNTWLVPSLGGLGASISTGISFVVFFWAKTLISRKLWFKFDIKFYFINVFLILCLSFISVFFNSIIIELILFGCIIFFNKKNIRFLFEIIKSFLTNTKQKKGER